MKQRLKERDRQTPNRDALAYRFTAPMPRVPSTRATAWWSSAMRQIVSRTSPCTMCVRPCSCSSDTRERTRESASSRHTHVEILQSARIRLNHFLGALALLPRQVLEHVRGHDKALCASNETLCQGRRTQSHPQSRCAAAHLPLHTLPARTTRSRAQRGCARAAATDC
jgi:hypothetical protein